MHVEPDPVLTQWSGFAHLTATKADRYRRILTAFADARRNYVVHLRPQDVARQLGEAPTDGLIAELDQLADWGNLRPAPDTTRVTSVEEFTRRRMLYSLTRTGEAVEAGMAAYAGILARRAELQTVALEDIRTGLAVLIGLAEAEQVDAARAAATLRDLDTVFSSLADNAAAFMSSLTRSIDTAAEGEEGFLAYKDGLIGAVRTSRLASDRRHRTRSPAQDPRWGRGRHQARRQPPHRSAIQPSAVRPVVPGTGRHGTFGQPDHPRLAGRPHP